ncbi:MAG: type 4a pilus biogenesis protein PilO [Candidatus Omnitrophota bacterium]
MKKSVKPQPNKIIIISALMIIATLFIGFAFIFMPFMKKSKALRSEILDARDKTVLIGRINAFDKHLKAYEKRMPTEGRGVSWLLSEVLDMAAKEQIEVSSIKPGTPEDRDLYVKLYVVMDTISTYDQLGRFISRVESHKKFLRIEQITVKRCDIDKDFDKNTSKFNPFDVKANIVINTVVFKD